MADIDFSMKQGATGTVLEFTLSDENGPFNFSGFQFVKITLQQPGIAPAVNQADCDMDPDQNTNTGQGEFSFGENANIPAGEYDLEWYAMDAADGEHYWPTGRRKDDDPETAYARILIDKHLG